jgi:environmental stress-induced protein Ves
MTLGTPASAHIASVRLADCAPQPWRNGGGITRELLVWTRPGGSPSEPAGSDWSVRVSVADIAHDGPFSSFPGIDRCFAVLEGEGVELDFDTGKKQQRKDDPPLFFAGESPVSCSLLNGPTRDLNLMGRRSHGQILMREATQHPVLDAGPRWRAVFCFEAATVHFGNDLSDVQVAAGTLCWSAQVSDAPWRLVRGGRALWLALTDREALP